MPDMLRDFVAAKGDTLVYAMSAPGGYTFQQHTTYAPTITGILSQPWDVVVLQEQSQLPSFPPAQVATDCYPYARMLDSVINSNDSCIETMFMMTWGRRYGDAMNCASYPVVCTYAGMQGRLRDSYLEMAGDNHASVAPMGAAWKVVIDSFPAINLYQADSSHPSVSGSYLQACVFYASIFHRAASGCSYLGGLSASTAATLQRIADKVVLDSLEQWQQHGHYPYAMYSRTHTGTLAVAFSNTSRRAGRYLWSFGDGAADTAANPSHTYTAAGTYTVTLAASNACRTELFVDTVHIGISAGLSAVGTANEFLIVRNNGSGRVTLEPAGQAGLRNVQTFDATGRAVMSVGTLDAPASIALAPGVYLLRFQARDGMQFSCRFSVF